MDGSPSVEDLRLVVAIGRAGSIGGAAREQGISQPSASQRLARLEQACGVRLFDRDAAGARITLAGEQMIDQARHILGHLDHVYRATRSADAARRLVVGVAPGIAETLLPVLDEELTGVGIDQRIDHVGALIAWVAEGTMDAAFVADVRQLTIPRSAIAHVVGDDELVVFVPAGVAEPTSSQGLRGRDLVYAACDDGMDDLQAKLISLGVIARPAATPLTGQAMARRRRQVAVLPRSVLVGRLAADERIVALPFRARSRLNMIHHSGTDPRLIGVLPAIRRELGLKPVRS